MEAVASTHIRIERPLYENDQLRQDLGYSKPKKRSIRSQISDEFSLKKTITTIIPSLLWLRHYKWRSDFVPDLVAGFTVAIMHIPQGMAYALLGNIPPVVGIYMAFFPVLVYFFLGTSKHVSMGTFAIICLMTGKAVVEHSDPIYFSTDDISELDNNRTIGYSPIQVATAVTFVAAITQMVMYVLRLGAISALLSETLVSGFTTGAAIQVFVSQIKDLLGLSIPKFKGYFTVYNTLYAICANIENVNYAAILIAALTISISVFNNEVLKPIVAKRCAFPVPIELIAVVLGTLVSTVYSLEDTYQIKTVGDIPSGFPMPTLPQFGLIPTVLVDGITVAIASYTITLSMGFIFAQKLNYEVDANQELLALSAANIVGSCFSCMAVCASLSRSLIQQVVGGKTQIVSIVSCSILTVVLLWIGPYFEPLPKCVLASVIVVALKGMLMQVKDFWKFWKISKIDALVWLVTCGTVVIVAIDIALLVGFVLSLVTIFILSLRPHTCLLGSVTGTDLYMDIEKYKKATEIEGLKIFHYSGGINFATRNIFRDDLYKLVAINPQKEVIYRNKLAEASNSEKSSEANVRKIEKLKNKINGDLKCLILDFSSLSHIDHSGISMIKTIAQSFQKLDVTIYIAACTDPVYNAMIKYELIDCTKSALRIFPSVHDAVLCSASLYGLDLESNVRSIIL